MARKKYLNKGIRTRWIREEVKKKNRIVSIPLLNWQGRP